jgi:hypothetical protein
MRMPLSIQLAVAMAAASLVFPAHPNAQTINLNPTCGTPGSSVGITGSGWPEPAPPCHYTFLFDGTSFAPDQADGLFGPPNASGTVPAGAAVGNHTVRTELHDDQDGHLEACRQLSFKVVSMIADPFNANMNITSNGNGFHIGFDPSGVCDVTKCTKIVPIQSRHTTGTQMDGTVRPLTYVEQGFDHPQDRDNDTTAAGYGTDRLSGRPLPYYASNADRSSPNKGTQGDMPTVSTMDDAPNRPSSAFPQNAGDPTKSIVKIQIDFETNFFCAEGENVGEFVGGKVLWKFVETLAQANAGTTGTSSLISSDRTQPTQNFLDALTLWGRAKDPSGAAGPHPFMLPPTTPPTSGGMPCS